MNGLFDNVCPAVRDLFSANILTEIDLHLLKMIQRQYNAGKELPAALQTALCLAGRVVHDSHVCLDLSELQPELLNTAGGISGYSGFDITNHEIIGLFSELREKDKRKKLFTEWRSIAGDGDGETPFVLENSLLYLRRYFNYERVIALSLLKMAKESAGQLDSALDEKINTIVDNHEQRTAIKTAMVRRLCVISGGPGTGKTYTAARILLLLSQMPGYERQRLRIKVAAPTGKAAARLEESLRNAGLMSDENTASQPVDIEPACTIDRLLGYRHGSPYFIHNADNPLPADVILIDEASMLDLPRMAKLLEAMRDDVRLILLGDMYQLASVQPGSVLGEICRSAALRMCVKELTISRRFEPGSPVAELAAAVKVADTEEKASAAWRLLARTGIDQNKNNDNSIRRHITPVALIGRGGFVNNDFAEAVLAGFSSFLDAREPAAVFDTLAEFRVLCAMRQGPFGVLELNRVIEMILAHRAISKDLTEKLSPDRKLDLKKEFYDHRVLMVQKNDYSLKLFNGDIGVVLPDAAADGDMKVFFEQTAESSDGKRSFRAVSCRLLPEHETAFAMTVHKAQGSEFSKALLMLPGRINPVLTRELVYTGITRVRERVELWVNENVFKEAIINKVRRFSGLGFRLEQLSKSYRQA